MFKIGTDVIFNGPDGATEGTVVACHHNRVLVRLANSTKTAALAPCDVMPLASRQVCDSLGCQATAQGDMPVCEPCFNDMMEALAGCMEVN